MSIIFVNSGQCGNQVCDHVIDSIYNNLSSISTKSSTISSLSSSSFLSKSIKATKSNEEENVDELDHYFRSTKNHSMVARAILLDTEPKVVNECLSKSSCLGRRWSYNPKNVIYRHGGAGNNWAKGYEMFQGEFLDASLELIRFELEKIDRTPVLLFSSSLAGGTGSGLGTHITEACEEAFSDVIRTNLVISPYNFGEVVVQYYNSLFCLSALSSSSNGIILFENEKAKNLCRKNKGIDRPSLFDINSFIAANVSPVLLPKYQLRDPVNGPRSRLSSASFSSDIIHLCSHPGYRIMTIKTQPQTFQASIEYTSDSWSALIGSLDRMDNILHNNNQHHHHNNSSSNHSRKPNSISSLLTLRGPDATTVDKNIFQKKCKVCYSHHVTNKYDRSASLISNSDEILPIIEKTAHKASLLFERGAYVHQYNSCGLEDEDFITAFRTVGQIIQNYRALDGKN